MRPNTPLCVIPFVTGRLRAETVQAVPATARFVNVGADDEAYWRLLRDLWAEGRTVIVVEHDIVPAESMIQVMWDCPKMWCCHPYDMGGIETTALGFVKFSSELLQHAQNLVNFTPEHRGWQSLDGMIVAELHRRGYQEHVHLPAVRHLHETTTQKPRRRILSKLHYIGDGAHYFNGVPAADIQTDDPVLVAQCLESGLYVGAGTRRAKEEGVDSVTKFVPIVQGPSEVVTSGVPTHKEI
jgi:hypothetical protein